MNNPVHNPADIALAAWQASGVVPGNIRKYQLRWRTWQEWCGTNGIDLWEASHEDYLSFEATHNMSPRMREQQASALFRPYRSVGKPSPAHAPHSLTDSTRRNYAAILRRYDSWCRTHAIRPLPARNQDVIAFLTELAKTHTKGYLKLALSAVSHKHIVAGYAPPSSEPAVTSALKSIQGTPRQLVTDTDHAAVRDRRLAKWANWCRGQGFEPHDATAEHFLSYLAQLATSVSGSTLKIYRSMIAQMYEDRTITYNPETEALIDAAPTSAGTKRKLTAIRKRADAEIQMIVETEAALMEQRDNRLPLDKRQRVARAMAHADITDQTLQDYVRYAWIPFKEWCSANGTSPEQATPDDISAFLCETADQKNPTFATNSHNGLNYVFNRIRPSDNPADTASVRKTLRGLKRERPRPPRQATPIGSKELAILIKAAHKPKYREFEHQTRLRAAVDIALLRTMHDTGIRGAEAADAEWEDLQEAPDHRGGSILTIRRSKTDQLHEGAVLYLTRSTTEAINHLKEVRRELGIADTGDRRIFRLSKHSIYRRIRAACQHAGLEGRYTMHSPRVGTAQELVTENYSDIQIMNLMRWTSQSSLTHYTKGAKATKNAVAQREKRRKETSQTPKRPPDGKDTSVAKQVNYSYKDAISHS